jgi:hypothetical protein
MHAGLIPIVGRDCSVVMPDSQFVLQDYSIDEIRSKVRAVCSMSDLQVKTLCLAVLQNARLHYSWEAFESSFRGGMDRIVRRHF